MVYMSYKKIAVQGTKWTTLSTVIVTLMQFVQVTILARILDPAAFGLVGMVMVLVNLFNIFSDMGVSNAIIYKQETNKYKLSSLYWLNIALGIFLFVLIIAIKPLIIGYYHEPKLESIIIFSSLIFLINPLGQQFQFLFQKDFEFKVISMIEIVSATIGTLVAIALALLNFEALSIIFGQLVTYLFKSCMFFILGIRKWRPLMYFNWKEIKDYFKFGLYSVGDNMLNFLSTNLGNLIIGSLLGARALGYYTIAYQLVIFPISKLNPIITRVSFPIFTKIKNDLVYLKQGYLQVLDIIGSLNFPLLIGLFVSSDTIIPLLYGGNWGETVKLVQILCIVGILRSLGNPLGSLLMSQGKPELGFRLNLITLIFQFPALYFGAEINGIYGVAIGFVCVQILNILLNFYAVHIIIGRWLWDLLKIIYLQFLIGMMMGIVIIIMNRYTIELNLLIQFIMQVVVGVTIYVIGFILLKKDTIKKISLLK